MMFIEANPKFKTITLYDGAQKMVKTQSLNGQEKQQTPQQHEVKPKEGQDAGEEGEAAPKQLQKSRKKKGQSIS